MNYAQIRKLDVTNGPDIRTTLFVSGCTHNCEGCFNKDQQNFNYGNEFTKEKEDEFISYTLNPHVKGVNILGGEPMQQIKDGTLLNLLRRIKKETNKPIWLWSGYTFEEIINNPASIWCREHKKNGVIDVSFSLERSVCSSICLEKDCGGERKRRP